MTAYMIFLRRHIHNADTMKTYTELARVADRGFTTETLVRYGELQVLEGAPVDGIFISSFPTVEEAEAWYNSDGYTRAREHRLKGADYDVYLVEGVPLDADDAPSDGPA